ncbi:hypothetical protein F2P79_017762 [Pimephales promelas]|nr:hypothetical protein F2P79_017762 [Pimephales promelas]
MSKLVTSVRRCIKILRDDHVNPKHDMRIPQFGPDAKIAVRRFHPSAKAKPEPSRKVKPEESSRIETTTSRPNHDKGFPRRTAVNRRTLFSRHATQGSEVTEL